MTILRIAYFDGTNYRVKYARWNGSTWQIETVESNVGHGYYTSLALDANDHPHISSAEYMSDLRYTYWDGTDWQVEIIDETVSCAWTSLAIDDSGASHIAYYDDSQLVLKYASKHPIPVDVTPPAAPQSLIATPGDGEVSLVWRMNMEVDVVSYWIYSGTSANPITLTDSTTIRNDTTKTIVDLLHNTKYYFRVTAVDDSGNESAYSIQDSATTLGSQGWHVSTTGSDDTGDGSEGNPFATIQYAINYAYHGDTVLVQPGTYVENINYNGKNIVVGSLFLTTLDTSYISQTVIDGGGVATVVSFQNGEDSTAVLSGFTITNGAAVFGGGIFCVSSSSPVLVNLMVRDNTVESDGGGIACRFNSSPIMENVTVSGNTAPNSAGGGIYLESYSSPRLTNVTVRGNTAGFWGGGIMCVDGANPNLVNVSVIGNISYYMGGGIYCLNNGNPSLTSVTVSGNTANDLGGGICLDNASPTITDVTISGNSALIESEGNSNGGGIYCNNNSSPSLVNVNIEGNAADWGAGIFLEGNSNPSLENVIVRGNTAAQLGGGMFIQFSSPKFTDLLVIENTAGVSGGGICMHSSILTSDGLYVDGNSAPLAGGIYTYGVCSISNATIINNFSEDGFGGIYAYDFVENAPVILTILNSNIADNGIGLYSANNSSLIDAANNWWGHPSGPYHPNFNTLGEGDSTNASVNIAPWLTSPDTTAYPVPPQNLTVTDVGDDFINLSWESSPFGDFAGFSLVLNIIGNGVDVFPEVVTETACSITGLPINTTYHIVMRVFDTAGNWSYFCDGVDVTTRVLEAQNLDIGGDEDLQHLITHIPTVSFDYYNSIEQPQHSYQIQVSTHSDFSSIDTWDSGEVNSNSTTVVYDGSPLVDGDTYYLRIRVSTWSESWGSIWGLWSNIEFRMNSIPSAPVGIAPIENEVVSGSPTLSVNNSSDPEGDNINYRFDLYDDALLTFKLDSALAVTTGAENTGWPVNFVLPDNGQYWWTVSANDGYESSSINGPYSFLVNTENNVPGAFTLLLPETGITLPTQTPAFSWNTAPDPDPIDTVRYSLVLLTPEPSIITTDVGTDTSFQIISPLLDDTEYHWRVIARDILGFETINEGDLQSFIVNTENSPPSPVHLITPSDSSHEITLMPEFYWTESTDPDPGDVITYTLKYWVDPIYVASIPSDTNSLKLATSLMDNSFYHWTVVSSDAHGSSVESEPSMFWTDIYPEPPFSFLALLPTDNSQGLSSQVEFVWHIAHDPDPLDFATYKLIYATDWSDSSTYTSVEGIEDSSVSVSMNNNSEYFWLVEAEDKDGQITQSNEGEPMRMVVGTLDIYESNQIPTVFALHQNYPNPFNPTTTFKYELPKDSKVVLLVFDMNGRLVETLVNEKQQSGYYSVQWNASQFSSGVYIYRIQADGFTAVKKCILMK